MTGWTGYQIHMRLRTMSLLLGACEQPHLGIKKLKAALVYFYFVAQIICSRIAIIASKYRIFRIFIVVNPSSQILLPYMSHLHATKQQYTRIKSSLSLNIWLPPLQTSLVHRPPDRKLSLVLRECYIPHGLPLHQTPLLTMKSCLPFDFNLTLIR